MFYNNINAESGIVSIEDGTLFPNQNGAMHWNNEYGKMTVFDGKTATDVYPKRCTLSLSPDVLSVISWARIKMKEEQTIKKMIEDSPAVKEAYDHFQTLLALTK